jgi:transcriptional antiterminator NusG
VGDYVTVFHGPFSGSDGKIIELNEEKGLLKVNINLLGRDTPLEIEFAHVKPKK